MQPTESDTDDGRDPTAMEFRRRIRCRHCFFRSSSASSSVLASPGAVRNQRRAVRLPGIPVLSVPNGTGNCGRDHSRIYCRSTGLGSAQNNGSSPINTSMRRFRARSETARSRATLLYGMTSAVPDRGKQTYRIWTDESTTACRHCRAHSSRALRHIWPNQSSTFGMASVQFGGRPNARCPTGVSRQLVSGLVTSRVHP